MRSRAYEKYPDYRVALEPLCGRLRVELAGKIVADSRRALVVRESHHSPVYYVPLEDVRAEWLEPSSLRTRCPFKGDASYWSVRVENAYLESAAWGYEEPYDEVAALRGHVAFLPERVDCFWLDGRRLERPV